MLCQKPILTIFDPDLPINIYTDGSIEGIGAILKQPQKNGEEKLCAYFSRKLNNAQKKKKAIYLECLAIKELVKYWQHWLIGKRFTVFTDYKPLEKMYIKASLSRNPVLEPYENQNEILKIVNFINLEDIKVDQERNEDIIHNNKRLELKDNISYDFSF